MASTINLANIKLGMETSALRLGFNIARGEIASLKKAFSDGESDMEKYNRHLDMLNKYFKNSAKDVHIYERALIGLQKRFKQGEFATPVPKSALSSRTEELRSRSTSADDKYASAMRELWVLKRQLNVTTVEFNRLEDQTAKQFGITTPRIKAQNDAIDRLAKAEKAAAMSLARHKELTEQSLTPQQKYIRAITEISQLTGRLAPGTAANNRLMEQAAKANGVVTVAIDRHTRALRLKQVQQDYINKGVQQANALLQSAMTMEQRHTAQLNQLTNAYRQGAISIDKYAQSLRQLKKEQGQEKKDSFWGGAAGSKIASAGAAMAGLAAAYAGTRAIVSFGSLSLKLSSQIETTTLAFDVMSGSGQKAIQMVKELRILDAKTPISFTGLADASKTLMGYGMQVKTIMPTLQSLSDISMGNEDKFKSLALAFGQVKAAGRLMGQEVLQMVNAGFNPLAEIAEQMAKKFGGLSEDYMPKLKKSMEDGKISFAMFEASVERATSAGGRFYGMTERSIDTMAGQFAQLTSQLEIVKIQFGESITPAVREFMTTMSSALSESSPLLETVAGGLSAIGMAFAAINGNLDEYMVKVGEAQEDTQEAKGIRQQKKASKKLWDESHPGDPKVQKKEFDAFWAHRMKWESEFYEWKKKNDQMNHFDQLAAYEQEFWKQDELAKKKQASSKLLLSELGPSTADEKAVSNFKKQIERIKSEYEERTKGKDKFDRDSLLKAMNFNKMDAEQKKQLQEALRMQRLNDEAAIAEKAKKEAEKNARNKKDIADALAKKQAEDVQAMHEKSRTPLTEFRETLQEIKRLQGFGLNAGDAGRAQKDAAEKFQKAQNPDNIARTTGPLIKAGSVEAYKLMDDKKEKQFLAAEQARIIASESLVVQQQIRDALNKDKLLVGMRR